MIWNEAHCSARRQRKIGRINGAVRMRLVAVIQYDTMFLLADVKDSMKSLAKRSKAERMRCYGRTKLCLQR